MKTKNKWIEKAVAILTAEPISWSASEASDYVKVMADTYYGEGFSPEEAVEIDSELWEHQEQ